MFIWICDSYLVTHGDTYVKGKKIKRSKDDSVQQRDDNDDALEATITLLEGQIQSQQEVIALQQQELVDLHYQCTSDDPDPKEEKAASFLSVQIASDCELRQLDEDGQVTAVGNVGASDTYVFSHFIDSAALQSKQQGVTCGGFLWTDGVCGEGLSCFTDCLSNSGRCCVPNGIAGDSCKIGNCIECGSGLVCNDSYNRCFNLKMKQRGETCGGFLWTDGICDDGLSCFTGGHSGNGHYCVPNAKQGACCLSKFEAAGIDFGKNLECMGCAGDRCPDDYVNICKICKNYQVIPRDAWAKKGSCNVNTGEPADAFVYANGG